MALGQAVRPCMRLAPAGDLIFRSDIEFAVSLLTNEVLENDRAYMKCQRAVGVLFCAGYHDRNLYEAKAP